MEDTTIESGCIGEGGAVPGGPNMAASMEEARGGFATSLAITGQRVEVHWLFFVKHLVQANPNANLP